MSGTPDLDEPVASTSQIQSWGKLISLNGAKANTQDLHDFEITIGRLPSNTIIINDNRLSGVHCKLKWDSNSQIAQIQDLSTNGTFIGDQKIGKNNQVLLKDGDEIYLLHKSKVPISEIIGFTLIIKKIQEVKVQQLDEQQQKKMQMMEDLQEDIHCPICDDVIYQCVCLIPCLHNFCGACFSDWMAKQKTCPTCRKDVQQVNKNPTINNLVEKYLQMHPDKKRPAEEYKFMDEKNQIKGDGLVFNQPQQSQSVVPVLNNVPPQRGGRGRGRGLVQQQPPPPAQTTETVQRQTRQSNISDYSADDDIPVTRDCATCIKPINGYQCQKKGAHLNCTNCLSKMPRFDLNEKRLTFRCTLCERFYCTLYNKNCQILNNKNPNLRIANHTIPQAIDIQCFRQNYFEHKAFLDYLKNNNITTQDLFQYMLTNYISKGIFRYIESKKTLAKPVREVDLVITNETPVCALCFGMIWQQIVFRYRIAIKDQMPMEIKSRSTCWFGVNCNTMTHNQEHAKRLDHMCEQTKF